ncbi:MAG: hypothetical protein F2786_03570 [Actinobacteria bacterium]|nr:hypothetical protein [Actinomycetota bacterium]
MGVIPSAHADEIIIEGYVTINYPATVKLNKSGCQNIAFKYVTDENLSRENTVFLVAITPNDSKRVYGYAAWLSTQTYMGDKALPPMARIGVLKVKVCRKAFMYSSKSTKLTLASKPGTYTVVFGAGTYDAAGSLTGEKIEFKRKIKFV